jgi:hypothetical protein
MGQEALGFLKVSYETELFKLIQNDKIFQDMPKNNQI